MASFQVRACSKAQASLNKILRTITSVRPPRPLRFGIDLNSSLVGALWESDGDGDGEYESGNLDACSFFGKEIESDSSGNNEEKTKEGSCSDITNSHDDVVETKPFKEQNDKSGNVNDCFGLLIAAAELISSTEAESSRSQDQYQDMEVARDEKATEFLLNAGESTTRLREETKSCTVDVEDTSAPPVVRSKRGRSRVLPYRYRDSVIILEPCKRRRVNRR